MSPATGTDELVANGNCSLSEAITNISDQTATYTECINTGDAYGVNNRINIPEGTITLANNLPPLTESVAITGQGMQETIIDGDSLYVGFEINANSPATISISKLKIKGFSNFGIFSNSSANVNLDQLEVDGSEAAGAGALFAVVLSNNGAVDNTSSISNVYIHDINGGETGDVGVAGGLGLVAGEGIGMLSATINGLTIERIHNLGTAVGLLSGTGVFEGGQSSGNTAVNADNVTVSNVSSSGSSAAGIAINTLTSSQNEVTNTFNVKNATVINIKGFETGYIGATSAITAAGSSATHSYSIFNATNLLLADNSKNCATADTTVSGGTGLTGVITNTINSGGGNISDDNTCDTHFAQVSDQNSVTNLKDFLGPLSFNGGYVPTIPLLQGSPAIDSGVTVSGLITDARGAVRPQGSAYDSGAYESPYTKTVTSLADTGENVSVAVILATAALLTSVGLVFSLRKQRC